MFARPDTFSKQTIGYNTAASGAASVITLAAPVAGYNVIDWVSWSYAAAPSSGELTITDGITTIKSHILAGGPGYIHFGERGACFAINTAVTVTLADGSATKTLNVQYR